MNGAHARVPALGLVPEVHARFDEGARRIRAEPWLRSSFPVSPRRGDQSLAAQPVDPRGCLPREPRPRLWIECRALKRFTPPWQAPHVRAGAGRTAPNSALDHLVDVCSEPALRLSEHCHDLRSPRTISSSRACSAAGRRERPQPRVQSCRSPASPVGSEPGPRIRPCGRARTVVPMHMRHALCMPCACLVHPRMRRRRPRLRPT